MYKYFTICCLMASASVASAYAPSAGLVNIATIDKIPNPNYEFNYAVNDPGTGDNKAQWETRNGDVVRGAYSLVEPDGNVRLVEYTADAVRGFNAVVKRTQPNVHSVSAVYEQFAPVVNEHIETPSYSYAPIEQYFAPLGKFEQAPLAPAEHTAPLNLNYNFEHEQQIAPLAQEPIAHGQFFTPYIETNHFLQQYPIMDYLPYPIEISQPQPWVTLSGSSYGHKGNIKRRWATGPISLDGKTLTIRTKH